MFTMRISGRLDMMLVSILLLQFVKLPTTRHLMEHASDLEFIEPDPQSPKKLQAKKELYKQGGGQFGTCGVDTLGGCTSSAIPRKS